MRSGFAIGRLFGVQIYIDWSWIFIFLLLVWQFGGGVLPAWHPDWPPALTWGTAILLAFLFFASVLAHELAHSLMAKARGLPVRRITLFVFGGVSSIEGEPPSPGAEFQIAIVGPVISLVLGAILLLLGGWNVSRVSNAMHHPVQVEAQLGPGTTILLWLGQINILLGLFNLIPGFPLDGGRVLRSLLWALTHNLRQATRWAAWVGQAIAWLFVVIGLSEFFGASWPFFGSGPVSSLWLVFIGWFLNGAAAASYQQVVI